MCYNIVMQKSERLLAITLLLHARGKMTAKRLASILGVSTRTIYRDIDILSLAHVPVSMDYGPGGGYYLPDDYHFESAIFTREEAVSLVLGADMAGDNNLFSRGVFLLPGLFFFLATQSPIFSATFCLCRSLIFFFNSDWRTW